MPLPNVSGKILAKVIEYCKKHIDAKERNGDAKAGNEEELKTWDTEYVKVLDQSTLFELILVRARACHASERGTLAELMLVLTLTVALRRLPIT